METKTKQEHSRTEAQSSFSPACLPFPPYQRRLAQISGYPMIPFSPNLNLNLNPNRNLLFPPNPRLRLRLGLRVRGGRNERLRLRTKSSVVQAVIGISFDQANKYGDDLLQRLFTGPRHFCRAFTSHSEEVQCRRTFQSRPSCDIKESAPIGVRKFSVALSQIQQHRSTCSIQLIPHRSRLRKRHQHGFQPANEGETPLVNLQFLVVKKSSRLISGSLHNSESYKMFLSPSVKQKLQRFPSSLNLTHNRNHNLPFFPLLILILISPSFPLLILIVILILISPSPADRRLRLRLRLRGKAFHHQTPQLSNL